MITLSGFQPRAKRARKKIHYIQCKKQQNALENCDFHRILGSQILARNKTAKNIWRFFGGIKTANSNIWEIFGGNKTAGGEKIGNWGPVLRIFGLENSIEMTIFAPAAANFTS